MNKVSRYLGVDDEVLQTDALAPVADPVRAPCGCRRVRVVRVDSRIASFVMVVLTIGPPLPGASEKK